MLQNPLRKSLFSFVAIGALALCPVLSYAAPSAAEGGQTGAIRGTVVDASSAAVAGADITLSGPNGRYTAHTDGRGKFGLIGVLSDTYTLTIRKDGVIKVRQPEIGVMGDQTVDLGTITLPQS